jgi:AcrR family transcriptional regulator
MNLVSHLRLTVIVAYNRIIMGDMMKDRTSQARIPQQRRSIQTKRQIIAAAMQLFSEKGFHATNSKEIAKAAGVATGCFYSYFRDKKAVFFEALRIYLDEFSAIFREHVGALDQESLGRREFLRGLIDSILDAHQVFTGFHNELIVMYFADPEIRQLTEEYDRHTIQFTLEYLRKAQPHLRVSDPEAAASVVYWAVQGMLDKIVFSEAEAERKQRLINELVDMVATYLFGDAG